MRKSKTKQLDDKLDDKLEDNLDKKREELLDDQINELFDDFGKNNCGDMLGKRVLDENKKLDDDGYLLDDTGSRLTRTLGETDDDLRQRMVKSIVVTDEISDVEWKTLGVVEADGGRWIPANLGRTFVSNNAVHNLFAAVPAQGSGIGTVMQIWFNTASKWYM